MKQDRLYSFCFQKPALRSPANPDQARSQAFQMKWGHDDSVSGPHAPVVWRRTCFTPARL